jgi:uncharacterized protein YdiU (UPF0061 family)
VIARQAELIAKWLLVGFIHGVMNTDNMSIAGETIDYGPCAFIDSYDPAAVYSSIDNFGRYAYANQPRIAQWNLARLAETLVPLLAEDEETAIAMANAALGEFAGRFETAYTTGLRRKLGLLRDREGDLALGQDCSTVWLATAQTSRWSSDDLATPSSTPRAMRRCGACSAIRLPTTRGPYGGAVAWARMARQALSGGRQQCVRSTRPSSRATIWWSKRLPQRSTRMISRPSTVS